MPDFHKPGIYGSVRVRANAWEVFRRTTFRVGRRRRAAVDFVVCYVCGGISFILRFFHFECTRPAASMRPPCLIYLSTSNEARPRERCDLGRFLPIGQKILYVMRQDRGSETTEAVFSFSAKSLFIPGCTGRHYLIGLSVCQCACNIRRFF